MFPNWQLFNPRGENILIKKVAVTNPKTSDPVSPMKILAGLKLKIKNPKIEPVKTSAVKPK